MDALRAQEQSIPKAVDLLGGSRIVMEVRHAARVAEESTSVVSTGRGVSGKSGSQLEDWPVDSVIGSEWEDIGVAQQHAAAEEVNSATSEWRAGEQPSVATETTSDSTSPDSIPHHSSPPRPATSAAVPDEIVEEEAKAMSEEESKAMGEEEAKATSEEVTGGAGGGVGDCEMVVSPAEVEYTGRGGGIESGEREEHGVEEWEGGARGGLGWLARTRGAEREVLHTLYSVEELLEKSSNARGMLRSSAGVVRTVIQLSTAVGVRWAGGPTQSEGKSGDGVEAISGIVRGEGGCVCDGDDALESPSTGLVSGLVGAAGGRVGCGAIGGSPSTTGKPLAGSTGEKISVSARRADVSSCAQGHTMLYFPSPLRDAPSHSTPPHPIPCHTIPYHNKPYHTIPPHTIPYHPIPSHPIPYYTTPYHPTIPYPIPSHPTPTLPHPIASHPYCIPSHPTRLSSLWWSRPQPEE